MAVPLDALLLCEVVGESVRSCEFAERIGKIGLYCGTVITVPYILPYPSDQIQ